jgi:predicted metal-dependent peptidase
MDKKNELKLKEKLGEIKIVESFTLLEESQILYSEILKRINFVITPHFNKAIAGIGYDNKSKKVYCFFNLDAVVQGSKIEKVINPLTKKESDEITHTKTSIRDIAGLLEHECAHMLLDHIFYIHHGKDLREFNRAKDYVINDGGNFLEPRYEEIKNPENNSVLNGGCFFREIRDKYVEFKDKTAHDFTSEEIYEILQKYPEKKPKPQPQSNGGNGNGEGEGFDEHSVLNVSVDENGEIKIDGTTSLSEEQMQELSNEVKTAVKSAINDLKNKGLLSKAIGQLKGEILAKISDLIKTTTDRNVVYNFTNSLKNSRKYSFKKINKRYPYIAQGRASDKKPILVLMMDSSGSMDNPEIRMMMGDQLYQLITITKQLHVVVGDTILQFSKHIENESDFNIEEIEFKGGGGTSLQFGWDYAESIDADGLVCHTDGHIMDFDDKGIPTMFYLYGEGSRELDGYDNYKVQKVD